MTARGLSAVHIRPRMVSYTPPQFLLPGVRDPRRDFPVLEPLGSMWHDSQQRQHVHPEALGSPSGYVVPAGHRLLRPHPSLWILSAAYGFAAEAAAPKEIGLGWESRGSPIYSAGLCSRAASHTPVAPKSASDCCFLLGFSLRPGVTGSTTTLDVSRLQSSFRARFVLILRPASWLALLSRTFTFELAPAGSPRTGVEYDYVGKQSIPTTGLSPASPTALWAAGPRRLPAREGRLQTRLMRQRGRHDGGSQCRSVIDRVRHEGIARSVLLFQKEVTTPAVLPAVPYRGVRRRQRRGAKPSGQRILIREVAIEARAEIATASTAAVGDQGAWYGQPR